MKKFKLIKKYPGSPKLGLEIKQNGMFWESEFATKNVQHFHENFNPKDYPEFWEEVVEKDYEILNFKKQNSSNLFTLRENGNYFLENDYRFDPNGYFCGLPESYHLDNDYEIYSVKRLSDGEVFTVGDRILRTDINDKYTIDKFKIQHNELKVYLIGMYVEININCIQKVKQPLFTTEDGVDVYEGDEVSTVSLDSMRLYTINGLVGCYSTPVKGFKYFSTKEAAEEYILMNTPCLSINEVIDLYIKTSLDSTFVRSAFTTRLKQIVKSK